MTLGSDEPESDGDSSSPHAVAKVSVGQHDGGGCERTAHGVRIPWWAKRRYGDPGAGVGAPDADTATKGQRMSERLRPRDVALLAEESPTTPMHNATVEIFEPGAVGLRLPAAGRAGPGPDLLRPALPPADPDRAGPDRQPGLGRRRALRHRLPRTPLRAAAAGSLDQLRELVSRIVSRPLDRSRPLWEIYVIEGLADGQFALLTKSHHVLVDGIDTVDLGQVLLDTCPSRRSSASDEWRPRRSPRRSR